MYYQFSSQSSFPLPVDAAAAPSAPSIPPAPDGTAASPAVEELDSDDVGTGPFRMAAVPIVPDREPLR